jgi:FMN reductase
MSHVVAIAGSISANSKSNELLKFAIWHVEASGFSTKIFSLRDIQSNKLLTVTAKENLYLKQVTEQLNRADAVIISIPFSKASNRSALKIFLEFLPKKALVGKIVLAIATGESQGHLLAIDKVLKPVLLELGAIHVLGGLYVSDEQVERDRSGQLLLDKNAQFRFDEKVGELEGKLLQQLDRVAV